MKRAFGLFVMFLIALSAAACAGPPAYYSVATDDFVSAEADNYVFTAYAEIESAEPDILDFTFQQSISDTMPPFTFRLLGEISWFYDYGGPPLKDIDITSIYIYDIDGNNIQRITNLETARGWPLRGWPNEENLHGLHFADYNFDGYLDMALWRHDTGSRRLGAFYYWLWDSQQMQFVLSQELIDFSGECRIEVDEDLQRLVHHNLWYDRGTTTYGKFIDGAFVVAGSEFWQGVYAEDHITKIGIRRTIRDYIADTEEILYEWAVGFEYALYEAFLETDAWVYINCPQCCGLTNVSNNGWFEITAKRILDFDGDGILDLWFRAEDTSGGREVITGFATIADGRVVLLLSGYISGGSIGGTFITSAYNQETSQHVIKLRGLIGGFGGRVHYAEFYSMENGELTLLYSIWHEYHRPWGHSEAEEIFKVNGEEVSEEVHNQIAGKFIDPVDDYFNLNLR